MTCEICKEDSQLPICDRCAACGTTSITDGRWGIRSRLFVAASVLALIALLCVATYQTGGYLWRSISTRSKTAR
jgi:hypothetical protein